MFIEVVLADSEDLLPLVYEELRKLAAVKMRDERSDHTLQATGLVHEAYLRIVKGRGREWENRAHFFHAAAEAMRRILIEHARAKNGPLRGGKRIRVPLDVIDLATNADPEQILAVEEAISRLESVDAGAAEVVRLRFYACMKPDEIANATERSPRSVGRDWAFARAFLLRELGEENSG